MRDSGRAFPTDARQELLAGFVSTSLGPRELGFGRDELAGEGCNKR
jgi:hypothetical protein